MGYLQTWCWPDGERLPERLVMNINQRRVLLIVALLVVGMLLYPPLLIEGIPNVMGSRNPGYTRSYGWLLSYFDSAMVHLSLLFTQFFVVAVVGAIAWLLCADKK